MATYLSLFNWTDQGIRTVKDSPKRLESTRKALKKLGGELKAFYMLQGHYDGVLIFDVPNDEDADEVPPHHRGRRERADHDAPGVHRGGIHEAHRRALGAVPGGRPGQGDPGRSPRADRGRPAWCDRAGRQGCGRGASAAGQRVPDGKPGDAGWGTVRAAPRGHLALWDGIGCRGVFGTSCRWAAAGGPWTARCTGRPRSGTPNCQGHQRRIEGLTPNGRAYAWSTCTTGPSRS